MASLFATIVADFARAHPFLVAANLVLAFGLAPIGDVLLPHLYGKLLSGVEKREASSRHLFRRIAYVIAALAVWQSGSVVRDLLGMHMQPRLEDFVRTRMVTSLIAGHDGGLSEQVRAGKVVSKIVRAPELVSWWVQMSVDYLIPYGATLVWVGLYFLGVDPWLAVAVGLLVATVFLLIWIAPERCIGASLRREEALQAVHERTDDIVRNLASIYGANRSDDEVVGVGELGERYRLSNVGAMLCLLRFKGIGVPLVIGFFTAVVLRCVHLVRAGRMTTGAFAAVFMMTTASVNTLSWLVSLIKEATLDTGTLVHAKKMIGDQTGLTKDAPAPDGRRRSLEAAWRASPPSLSMTGGVTVVYPGIASRALSFPDGEFVGGRTTRLDGAVGSGKSTALRLLAGLTRPSTGEIRIGGVSYEALGGLPAARRLIGFMPQEAVLFDRTAGENVLYGAPPGATEASAVELAKSLGVWDALSPGLPQGMATPVGKGGSRLSGGQRQLVWFLRIAVRDPPCIVLDEPTASMDATTRDALLVALSRLPGPPKTIVIATHDDSFLDGVKPGASAGGERGDRSVSEIGLDSWNAAGTTRPGTNDWSSVF